ncbi:MAG TPA: hypothetical protein VK919_12800 [Solirubrobacterales bacterium]|nr:hypothetical protein [Solirubrobacterales bacterium]
MERGSSRDESTRQSGNRPALGWLAVVGYLALTAALIWEGERLSDPLPDLVLAIVSVVGILAAGALAGEVLFVVMSFAVFASLLVWSGPLAPVFVVVVLLPATAALLLVGVIIGRVLRRSRSAWRPGFVAAVLAVCVTVPAVAAGYDVVRPARDVDPDDPLIVDWRKGSLGDVRFGDEIEDVWRAFGRSEPAGPNEPVVPLGEDYYEIGGPTGFGAPPGRMETVRYDDHAIFLTGGSVHGGVTTSPRATTPEGVGVGDSREIVERRYPRAHCYVANEGSEYSTFPLCEVRACDRRRLAFGGEPIRSIWLVAVREHAVTQCRDPEKPTPD